MLFRMIVRAAVLIFVGHGACNLWAQGSASVPAVLHIQQTKTISQGSQNGFPTYLAMYHVLDGAKEL